MRGLLVLVVLLLLLGGCVSSSEHAKALFAGQDANAAAVAGKIKVMPDPHAGWTRILGPMVLADGRPGGRRYVVIGWNHPSDPAVDGTFELQVSAGFPKRVYLKQIYAEGRSLPTAVIDRERIYCGYECTTMETVATRLNEAQMARLAQTGLALEVIGRRDDIRLSIPPAYFEADLTATLPRALRAAGPPADPPKGARPGDIPPKTPRASMAA